MDTSYPEPRISRRKLLQSIPAMAGFTTLSGCLSDSEPTHVSNLSGSTLPAEPRADYFKRTFKQDVGNYTTTFDLEIPKTFYNYYTNRVRTNNYGGYVSERHDDDYLSKIADEMLSYGDRKNLNEKDTVHQAMGIVQNLKYTPDGPGQGYEYPKFPVETLYDKGGDCEDTSILAASILEQMGYDVILLGLPEINHMAVGISKKSLSMEGGYYKHDGKKYLYLETTSGGWRPGQLPKLVEEYNNQHGGFQGIVYELNDQPVLAHEWQTRLLESGKIETRINTLNVGDDIAEKAKAAVEFVSEDGVKAKSGPEGMKNIRPETGVISIFENEVPGDERMRIRTSVYLSEQLVDKYLTPYIPPNNG